MKKILMIYMLLSLVVFGYSTDSKLDRFEGYWKMEDGNFILEIEKDDNGIYNGHTVWLKNPTFPKGDKDEGKLQVDRNNCDPELRDRPVLGLEIISGFRLHGEKLSDGWIYDSWHGNRYYGSASIEDKDTLNLKGSVDKFGILGHTMKAYRVKPSEYIKYGLNSSD